MTVTFITKADAVDVVKDSAVVDTIEYSDIKSETDAHAVLSTLAGVLGTQPTITDGWGVEFHVNTGIDTFIIGEDYIRFNEEKINDVITYWDINRLISDTQSAFIEIEKCLDVING